MPGIILLELEDSVNGSIFGQVHPVMISGYNEFRDHRWGGRGGHGRVGLPVRRGGLGTADKCT